MGENLVAADDENMRCFSLFFVVRCGNSLHSAGASEQAEGSRTIVEAPARGLRFTRLGLSSRDYMMQYVSSKIGCASS